MKTHRASKTLEYRAWKQAKNRCNNPSWHAYHRYGGRGIRFAECWANDFPAFFAELGPRPAGYTLDRIDVEKDYEPGNCRWASWIDQQRNRANNVRAAYNGKSLALSEIAEIEGIATNNLHYWAKTKGWPIEEAIARCKRLNPNRRRRQP